MNKSLSLLTASLLGIFTCLSTGAHATLSVDQIVTTSAEKKSLATLIKGAADQVRQGKNTPEQAAKEVTSWKTWGLMKSKVIRPEQFKEAVKARILEEIYKLPATSPKKTSPKG